MRPILLLKVARIQVLQLSKLRLLRKIRRKSRHLNRRQWNNRCPNNLLKARLILPRLRQKEKAVWPRRAMARLRNR